jgi:hypothetical protein
MKKSAQFMAGPFPGGPISGVETCPHDSRRTRYDVIGEHLFSATEWSLVAGGRLVAEFRDGGTAVVAPAPSGALEFAQHDLKDRYHMVRYEDLCRKPAETVMRLLEFLGAPKMDVGPLIEGIRDRGNIGRWRRAGAAKVVELGRGAQADLKRFGYEV